MITHESLPADKYFCDSCAVFGDGPKCWHCQGNSTLRVRTIPGFGAGSQYVCWEIIDNPKD